VIIFKDNNAHAVPIYTGIANALHYRISLTALFVYFLLSLQLHLVQYRTFKHTFIQYIRPSYSLSSPSEPRRNPVSYTALF
jgi:hypothetical protein